MREIKISTKKPPQWILDEVKEKFDVDWTDNIIFTYGDLITSHTGIMSEDLSHHEPHHTKQQEAFGGADKWWREYLNNETFRYNQELECYRKQYRWVKNNIKDRNLAFNLFINYAKSLSGKMYGNVVDINKAMREIKL
jgi:hypothetical protein